MLLSTEEEQALCRGLLNEGVSEDDVVTLTRLANHLKDRRRMREEYAAMASDRRRGQDR